MRRIFTFIIAASLMGATAATAQSTAKPRANIVARAVRVSLSGIELTAAEKSNLAIVSAVYAARFKAIAGSRKPAVKTLRRSTVSALRSSLLDVRAALAPAHQPQFDANLPKVRRMLRHYVRAARPI
jgi:hypothetical protein